jgi:hypothetical protein
VAVPEGELRRAESDAFRFVSGDQHPRLPGCARTLSVMMAASLAVMT